MVNPERHPEPLADRIPSQAITLREDVKLFIRGLDEAARKNEARELLTELVKKLTNRKEKMDETLH